MFISNSALLSEWLYWMLQIAYLSTNAFFFFFPPICFCKVSHFCILRSYGWKVLLYINWFITSCLCFNKYCLYCGCAYLCYLIYYYNYWVRNMLFRCYLQESIMFQQKIFFCICKHLDYQNYYVYILKDHEWEMITFICLYWQYFCSFYISVI
jgi:hypothetical protein